MWEARVPLSAEHSLSRAERPVWECQSRVVGDGEWRVVLRGRRNAGPSPLPCGSHATPTDPVAKRRIASNIRPGKRHEWERRAPQSKSPMISRRAGWLRMTLDSPRASAPTNSAPVTHAARCENLVPMSNLMRLRNHGRTRSILSVGRPSGCRRHAADRRSRVTASALAL
jgi:hypothetical protein